MLTLISGTNRPNSKTRIITDSIHDVMIHKCNDEIVQINLENIDSNIYHNNMYDPKYQLSQLSAIQDEVIIPSEYWIIVCPEYNGSYSGALKVFIDALSIRKYKQTFYNKKLALVGVSAGKAGNLIGLDHLASFFNYLGMHIMPLKLPISSIEGQFNGSNLINETENRLIEWCDEAIKYFDN